MTAWRTAAAVALAAHCLSPNIEPSVGIVGTGQQAQLAIDWIAELLPLGTFTLLGRDSARTRATADRFNARTASSIAALLMSCDIVVTATPASRALFEAQDARAGQHFVGVGADGVDKQELPQRLYSRASVVLTDDHPQCLALSDFGRAVRDGDVASDFDMALGDVLSGVVVCDRRPNDITIVDLTGVAAQDNAIANLFFAKLQQSDR